MKILVTVERIEAEHWVVQCPVIASCSVRGKTRDEALGKARWAIKSTLDNRAGRELAENIELLQYHVFADRKADKISWAGEKERIEALIRAAQSTPVVTRAAMRTIHEGMAKCLGRFRSRLPGFAVPAGLPTFLAGRHGECAFNFRDGKPEVSRFRRS
jgi:predicted RNase H-like HicB family nuclease